MNKLGTIFTCAALGEVSPAQSPEIFWLMLLILLLDEEARREKERRRIQDLMAAAPAAPKPSAGPR